MKRDDLEKIVKVAKKMNTNGEYVDLEFGKLCMAVVDLIEKSDFGRNDAEVTLSLGSIKANLYDQVINNSFDGVAVQFLNIAEHSLGSFGTLSAKPYTGGLSTRSATVQFRKKTK